MNMVASVFWPKAALKEGTLKTELQHMAGKWAV